MFMRCAYFVGQPVASKAAEFQARLDEALKRYMGFERILSAQMLMAREREDGAPNIYATLQLCFRSEADLRAALASPFRTVMRAYFVEQVFPLFEGSVTHINHDVSEQSA